MRRAQPAPYSTCPSQSPFPPKRRPLVRPTLVGSWWRGPSNDQPSMAAGCAAPATVNPRWPLAARPRPAPSCARRTWFTIGRRRQGWRAPLDCRRACSTGLRAAACKCGVVERAGTGQVVSGAGTGINSKCSAGCSRALASPAHIKGSLGDLLVEPLGPHSEAARLPSLNSNRQDPVGAMQGAKRQARQARQ